MRAFLDESVGEAERIAVAAARQANVERARYASQLREDILLCLFSDLNTNRHSSIPRKSDIKGFEQTRRSLKAAFSVLGIPAERAESAIDPFFSDVIGIATKLTKFSTPSDAFSANNIITSGYIDWVNANPRLSLISQIETYVQKFNINELGIFSSIRLYEEIMNAFLSDSNKSLGFSDDGSLSIGLPLNREGNVHYLSSGERQLFVLITNLMFNIDKKQANIVIIDEPELSLHIKWQEMFVSSLERANPNTQIILATHSPSIIYDREENCVDLL